MTTEQTFNKQIAGIHAQIMELQQKAPEKKQYIMQTITLLLEQVIKKDEHIDNEDLERNIICKSIKEELMEYHMDADFMKELRNAGGCVTGSMVLKHIMEVLWEETFKMSDIDVLIPTVKSNSHLIDEPKFILDFATKHELQKKNETAYQLVDYICYSYTLGDMYNIIYITCDVDTFIRTFDMGCCKNYYNGDKLVSLEYDAIKEGKTSVAYNKIPVNRVYKGMQVHWDYDSAQQRISSIYYTPLYVQFRIICDMYLKKEIVPYKCIINNNEISNITQYTKIVGNSILQPSNMEEFLRFYKYNQGCIEEINRYFPFTETLDKVKNSNEIDQNVVDCMNMIRCHGRILKYTARGIKTFDVVA